MQSMIFLKDKMMMIIRYNQWIHPDWGVQHIFPTEPYTLMDMFQGDLKQNTWMSMDVPHRFLDFSISNFRDFFHRYIPPIYFLENFSLNILDNWGILPSDFHMGTMGRCCSKGSDSGFCPISVRIWCRVPRPRPRHRIWDQLMMVSNGQ